MLDAIMPLIPFSMFRMTENNNTNQVINDRNNTDYYDGIFIWS